MVALQDAGKSMLNIVIAMGIKVGNVMTTKNLRTRFGFAYM